jgi:UDP-N-acetylglucosamine 2-epimerase (non-hydrolysing)
MPPQVLIVVGARPNFVKVAPVVHAARELGAFDVPIVHTGQHYDVALSELPLAQLGMPTPDHHLEVGSGTHAEQTAAVMVGVERTLQHHPADAVLVAGDVNSTMGAALAASKLGVPVIHLEAGLRSGDWSMPEEINRVVTDRISDLLLCPSADAVANLRGEGIEGARVVVVGNTMIDSLATLLEAAKRQGTVERLGLQPRRFVLVTLHRPSLVDDDELLMRTLDVLAEVADSLPVLMPVHPRTRDRLGRAGYVPPAQLQLTEPLGYLDFIALESAARLVVTDSGGVQEETSVLGVPCLTYRTTTERPITVTDGTNQLVGLDPDELQKASKSALVKPFPQSAPQIPLWDGNARFRVVDEVATFLQHRGALTSLPPRRSVGTR